LLPEFPVANGAYLTLGLGENGDGDESASAFPALGPLRKAFAIIGDPRCGLAPWSGFLPWRNVWESPWPKDVTLLQ